MISVAGITPEVEENFECLRTTGDFCAGGGGGGWDDGGGWN